MNAQMYNIKSIFCVLKHISITVAQEHIFSFLFKMK